MQSVGSASSQASSDWPSSGEDDLEVFLSEEERAGVGGGHSRSSTSSLSSSSSSSSMESEREKEKEKAAGTQGDLLFAQKCLELQGFVRPMLELLNGLKKGRFDKGLSSFQQSVAMDRIQRIVGVLQKPHIGEKYLPTLLQVEMMLKHWFPQVSLQQAGPKPSSSSNSSVTPPHKHKDQLHIPVKKRRLSWSDTDSSQTPPPIACKRSNLNEKDERVQELPFNPAPADLRGEEPSGSAAPRWSEPSLTWVHVAPIPSPPKSCPSQKTTGGSADHFLLAHPPPASRGSPATQDNAVSSTTPCPEPVAPQSRSETPTQTEGRDPCPAVTTQVSSSLQT